VSSHADTIRRALSRVPLTGDGSHPDVNDALDAVTEWEAENQQLRDALERIAANGEAWELPPRGVIAMSRIARSALAAVRVEER
jgi:hypothetical protein